MKVITKAIHEKLIKNHAALAADPELDQAPVVKLFGGAACTWLLSDLDPETDMAFGLCDLGFGTPELGYVPMDELLSLRFPPFGLPIERDAWFKPNKTIFEYADMAREASRIVT